LEGANAAQPNLHSFGTQQLPFDLQVPAVASQRSARSDHAVVRNAWFPGGPHDVADGARRPRLACKRRDIAVGRYTPRRDAPDRRQHAPLKVTFQ
jgi:hypothetical protein